MSSSVNTDFLQVNHYTDRLYDEHIPHKRLNAAKKNEHSATVIRFV